MDEGKDVKADESDSSRPNNDLDEILDLLDVAEEHLEEAGKRHLAAREKIEAVRHYAHRD